ncbi:DUF4249 domain-containing protein [Emticicia sp. C21]|uniref:DUF4249 domain-containing protein n=1 Tax=Emticicia sp. C21 TaxID=2302915 RepID=UPI000E346D1C|nr:DUF4249 domain-containing protein [Emticicia sp. C21]RFS14011.1 DUF4249 domain-containing protein [Emticicia sp. C21]
MLRSKSFLLLLCICILFYACVEPFELERQKETKILTIDATITDLADEQTVKITESYSSSNVVFEIPVTNAKVEIVINNNERVPLYEKTKGVYALPISFHTRVGEKYKLVFEKEDGTKYESTEERQSEVSDITKVYNEFKIDGIESNTGDKPAFYVYLDTNDPANEKNNYMWSWKLWENQNVCMTCVGGRYFTTPAPARCRMEAAFSEVTYDYGCSEACYQIFYNPDLNVYSDVFSNGQPIIGRLIGKIPYYSNTGALLEIKQQSISSSAYQYMKLLANQVQNNGSLVDTPPAAIIGNVKNVAKSDEPVAGFFMVTSVRSVKYWLDKKNASVLASPIGVVDHPVNFEPSAGDPRRPPQAPCEESRVRTRFKPDGWVN